MTQSGLWSRRLASGWLFWPLCLAAVALVTAGALGPVAQRRLAVEHQCAAMQAEVAVLEETAAQLEAARAALESDPAYAERVVRRELGLTRPGEVALPRPPQAGDLAPPEPQEPDLALRPALELVARFAQPRARLGALVAGCVLLGAGLILSLPGHAEPRRTRLTAAKRGG